MTARLTLRQTLSVAAAAVEVAEKAEIEVSYLSITALGMSLQPRDEKAAALAFELGLTERQLIPARKFGERVLEQFRGVWRGVPSSVLGDAPPEGGAS